MSVDIVKLLQDAGLEPQPVAIQLDPRLEADVQAFIEMLDGERPVK